MDSYGIPPKLVRMVKAMYDGNRCAVVDGACQTGWFDARSGVKQGCNMSWFLFLLVIDWIMRKTLEADNTGIGWKLWNDLYNLRSKTLFMYLVLYKGIFDSEFKPILF